MMQRFRVFSWIGLFVVGMFISACGGGSSSSSSTPVNPGTTDTTISGVAAAGAPLSGVVTLIDSRGEPTNPRLSTLINADGSFSFNIADRGLVPPFFLRAEGTAGSTRYVLHSAVTAPGTANINPLTEAQVAIATGKDPAALYDDPSSNALSIDAMETALAQASDDLMDMLSPLLDTWVNVPRTSPITLADYVANGEGLDKLFDILNVVISPTKIGITDRSGTELASVEIGQDGHWLVSAISNEKLDAANTVSTALDEIREFLPAFINGLKDIQADYANSTITQDQARTAVGNFFAAGDWVNFGYTRDEEIEDYIGESDMLEAIKSVANARIVKENFRGVDGVYLVDFFLVLQLGEGAETIYPEYSWALVKEGDSWKITGNGYYARIGDTLWFSANRNITSTGVRDVVVARFDPEDRQGVFSSATITGPGLPEDGITFETPVWDNYMHFADQTLRACAKDVIDCPPQYQLYNSYELTDQAITAMDQVSQYTMTYSFSDTNIDDEVHTINVVKPLPISELTDEHFPEIYNLNNLTKEWALANLIDRSFTYEYSTPTAFAPAIAEFSVDSFWSANNQWSSEWFDELLEIGQDLSHTTTIPSPEGQLQLQWFTVQLQIDDALWRAYSTRYYFE